MKLNIITIEEQKNKANSALKNKAEKVIFPLSEEDSEIIEKMKAITYAAEGVGLAAPQVNIRKQIAIIYIPESAALLRDYSCAHPIHTIINPEYSPVEKDGFALDFEGCYSVTTVYGKVKRYKSINLKYQNEEGKLIKQKASGFYARVLQHEIDHLNGILITDRLTPDSIQGTFSEMLSLRRAELPEEKREHFDALLKKKGMLAENKQKECDE
jgi:peptide deformylase